jgi:F-type H+-transporting ATPase subunit b
MLPQFEVSFFPSQIFWLIVSFSIFYVFVKYSFLPKISEILEKREAKIKADMIFYERNISDIAKTKNEYEAMISDAKKEAEEQIKKAKLASQKFTEERIVEIDKTMNTKFEAIKLEIESDIASIRKDLRKEALATTMNILEKIEGVAPEEEKVKKYLA